MSKTKIYCLGNYKTDAALIEWEAKHHELGKQADALNEEFEKKAMALKADADANLLPAAKAMDESWDMLFELGKAKGFKDDVTDYSAYVNRETGDVFLYQHQSKKSDGLPPELQALVDTVKAKGGTVHIEEVEVDETGHTPDCPDNPKNAANETNEALN